MRLWPLMVLAGLRVQPWWLLLFVVSLAYSLLMLPFAFQINCLHSNPCFGACFRENPKTKTENNTVMRTSFCSTITVCHVQRCFADSLSMTSCAPLIVQFTGEEKEAQRG